MIRQIARGRLGDAARQERRRQYHLRAVVVVVTAERCAVVVVDTVREAECVGAGGRRWGFAEGLGVGDGFEADDFGERGWVQPGGRDYVGAALFLEEEGEPEGELGAVRRFEGRGFALVKERGSLVAMVLSR